MKTPVQCTGKYLSEALVLASTNPQYDDRSASEKDLPVHSSIGIHLVPA